MTKAKVRRLTNRLDKMDRVHLKMGKKIDDLKQDLLELQMESAELRSDLLDLVEESQGSGKKSVQSQVSAIRQNT